MYKHVFQCGLCEQGVNCNQYQLANASAINAVTVWPTPFEIIGGAKCLPKKPGYYTYVHADALK